MLTNNFLYLYISLYFTAKQMRLLHLSFLRFLKDETVSYFLLKENYSNTNVNLNENIHCDAP